MIESLGKDKFGRMSSLPSIKSGTNRGLRHVEKSGSWTYLSSYLHANQDQRVVSYEWAEKLGLLKFRIGTSTYDGVTSFWIFMQGK